jgi:hypothetical protein
VVASDTFTTGWSVVFLTTTCSLSLTGVVPSERGVLTTGVAAAGETPEPVVGAGLVIVEAETVGVAGGKA